MIDRLEAKEWLTLNAKLQQKKNALRKDLAKRGVLKREGKNSFDNYKYFSEAQYKELMTELLSANKLDLSFTEANYESYDGTQKMPFGRRVTLTFKLYDTETGFYEESHVTAESMDKGDKAGFKAYTGAIKYYLANTFLVATGDDPERDSVDDKDQKIVKQSMYGISDRQVEEVRKYYTDAQIEQMCATKGVKSLKELPQEVIYEIISFAKKKAESKANA